MSSTPEDEPAQAKLEASEERYRLALAATRDAVWVWDIARDSQIWNQAGAELFGWTEIVEQPQSAQWWVDRVHPDDRERVGGAFHAAIQDPSVIRWEDEYRFVKRDGTYAWVLDRGYIVRDARGAALRAVGAMQDITERKCAQEVAAHFAAVVGSSCDAIVSKTLNGVVTSWNAAAERMFGYSAAEMVGDTMRRLIPEEFQDEERRILARVSSGESIQPYETVRLTKDGRRVDLSLTISPITDSNGHIIGASVIGRDIMEQKRQRTVLKESEERFRTLADQMLPLVWMMDPTGSVYWLNQRWYDYTGTTFETMQGWGWQSVHHPDHVDRVVASKRRAIDTGETWDEVFPLRGRDGAYRWFLTRAVPIRDKDGGIVRWLGTNTDITERKQSEEDLRGRERLLSAVFNQQLGFSALLTPDGRIVKLSESVYRGNVASKTSQASLIGSRFLDAPWWRDHPETIRSWHRQFDDVLRHEGAATGEGAYRTQDGQWRYALNSLTALRDDRGAVEYLLAEGVDITPQKLAEQELGEQRRLYRSVTDNASVALFIMDSGQRCVFMNPAAEILTGYSLDETRGRPLHDVVHHTRPDGRPYPITECPIDQAFPQQHRMQGEETFVHKDGRFYQVAFTASPMRDAQGAPVGTIIEVQDIADRKRAELALSESESRFRELVERSPFGIYVVDAQFRIAHMNEAGQKGAFCNVRPVIGRDLDEAMRILWPEPVAAQIIDRFRDTLETGRPYRSRDFLSPRADLEQTEGYEWELHRLTLPDGRYGVICYYFDSTRLRSVEAALRESDERLRTAMMAGGMGAWDIDLATGVVEWDVQQYQIFGLSPDRSPLAVEEIYQLVHPDDLDHVQRIAAEAERNDRFSSEFRIIRPDGSVRWIAGRGAVVAHADNRPQRMVGINYDVTERKRHEALSAEQRQLLELIAMNRPLGECLDALTGAVTRLEPNACAALLVADAARLAVAETFSAHLPAAFGEAIRGAPISDLPIGTCGTAIHTGNPVTCSNVETEGPWSDVWRTLCVTHGIKACHSQPVFGQDGMAIASFFVCLTEPREPNAWERQLAEFGAHLAGIVLDRDRAAKVLRENQERLQAAAADLERRVEERTHELLRSQADLRALASELNLTEQRERKRLAGDLHDHLQQMLVYGKMQLGRGMLLAGADPACLEIMRDVQGMLSGALTYTHTLVAELCPPVLREHGLIAGLRWLADYMKRYGMQVTVTLPDEEGLVLPEDWTILLFQSVRELLMNAHKYAETGSADVSLSYGRGSLIIHVRDRGKGFDSAAAISPDLTVGGSSSKFGLFSIKERMRTLGGSFGIASVPGKGTTATLRLPLTSRAAETEQESEEREAAAASDTVRPDRAGSRPIRVLLVDDHVMIRQGLRAMLETYSDIALVGEAGNGEEAVALVDQLKPSVVIMDISMPKMNGIEATGRIIARHPMLPIIGLSVNAGGDNRTAMLKAGARRLLTKEAAVEQLYGAIKHAVGLVQ